ncbi:MAG TPA: amino acid adenylation domain-containing protein, partial [Burkholderiaceae bacterium]|nr:amino acid adenylation domain-containing protein [Burkholderiaceae bacterium]
FAVYKQHLRDIRAEGSHLRETLPSVPAKFLQVRANANRSQRELPGGLLHHGYADACRRHAGRIAIADETRELTYDTLWRYTTRAAALLRGPGVRPNDLVAVVARRGWRQVAAAIAVVQAGGAYLPVDVELPAARRDYLVARPGVKAVLVEGDLIAQMEVPAGVHVIPLEEAFPDDADSPAVLLHDVQGADDLAYVIFTSGSTGTPKGVAITHRGAVNTLQDVVRRFGLDPDDRVMGLSAFNFDLSVYDIFATLAHGAALVLPTHSPTPSPENWRRVVTAHRITVWNSVPALLEMMLEYCGHDAARDLGSLRLIMLSGDWIPIALAHTVKSVLPQAMFVSLGGATEASIWSNYFIIDRIFPSWTSIPYGWPLANQTFHVLNSRLQPVPTWVAGDLYIGGAGLAREYYRDRERTAESFIVHPVTGERLYRTGDLGRYDANGCLIFLGRRDTQVKIRGFRIELGEIDIAMQRCPGVRGAATVVRRCGSRDSQLVGFYAADADVTEDMVRAHVAATVPDYMVPALLMAVEQIPVTSNGKVDRGRLQAWALESAATPAVRVEPRNPLERMLARLWQGLLNVPSPCIHDDFFHLGGTSLLAVRLLKAIETETGRQLPLASLLRHGTIAAQASLLRDANVPPDQPRARAPVVPVRAGGGKVLAMVHPVGGNVLCYRHLLQAAPADAEIVALQSPGHGQPRTIATLAASYVDALAPQLHSGREIHLLGWSMGGVVAHEMARIMAERGTPAAGLLMIDSWMGRRDAAGEMPTLDGFTLLKTFAGDFLDGAELPAGFLEMSSAPEQAQFDAVMQLLRDAKRIPADFPAEHIAQFVAEHQANYNALIRHWPGKVGTCVLQLRAARTRNLVYLEPFAPQAGCDEHEVTVLDEDHHSILHSRELLAAIRQALLVQRREAIPEGA